MTRRSIFKSLVACVAASAIEVCGWKMPEIKDDPLMGYWRATFMEGYAPPKVPEIAYRIIYKRNGGRVSP